MLSNDREELEKLKMLESTFTDFPGSSPSQNKIVMEVSVFGSPEIRVPPH
jgi:hypothetical protein